MPFIKKIKTDKTEKLKDKYTDKDNIEYRCT